MGRGSVNGFGNGFGGGSNRTTQQREEKRRKSEKIERNDQSKNKKDDMKEKRDNQDQHDGIKGMYSFSPVSKQQETNNIVGSSMVRHPSLLSKKYPIPVLKRPGHPRTSGAAPSIALLAEEETFDWQKSIVPLTMQDLDVCWRFNEQGQPRCCSDKVMNRYGIFVVVVVVWLLFFLHCGC